MKDDVYPKLCEHMNQALVGAPKTEEFLEILRLRFTAISESLNRINHVESS